MGGKTKDDDTGLRVKKLGDEREEQENGHKEHRQKKIHRKTEAGKLRRITK